MNDFTQHEAQRIAEGVVGAVEWNGSEGLCICPGIQRHTTGNALTDCKVVCEPLASGLKPGVYCFHENCSGDTDEASRQLRSALGKRCPGTSTRKPFAMPRPPKPEYDPACLARLAGKVSDIDADWLATRSPKTPWNRTPASFLHELYQPGEIVLVFDNQESQGQTAWEHRPPPFDARELDHFTTGRSQGVWFLNQPVSGAWVEKESGQGRTRRRWQTVTAWRYLVLESDKAPADQWLAGLVQIPLPIAAIYTSGGRSIHALVKLDKATKEQFDATVAEMKPGLVTLGADLRAMSAVRLTRLPCCERVEKGQVQSLLYLNGQPTETPIYEMVVAA